MVLLLLLLYSGGRGCPVEVALVVRGSVDGGRRRRRGRRGGSAWAEGTDPPRSSFLFPREDTLHCQAGRHLTTYPNSARQATHIFFVADKRATSKRSCSLNEYPKPHEHPHSAARPQSSGGFLGNQDSLQNPQERIRHSFLTHISAAWRILGLPTAYSQRVHNCKSDCPNYLSEICRLPKRSSIALFFLQQQTLSSQIQRANVQHQCDQIFTVIAAA